MSLNTADYTNYSESVELSAKWKKPSFLLHTPHAGTFDLMLELGSNTLVQQEMITLKRGQKLKIHRSLCKMLLKQSPQMWEIMKMIVYFQRRSPVLGRDGARNRYRRHSGRDPVRPPEEHRVSRDVVLKAGVVLWTSLRRQELFSERCSCSWFVHRCGRTARMGHSGLALLLIRPNEEPYINLLGNAENRVRSSATRASGVLLGRAVWSW